MPRELRSPRTLRSRLASLFRSPRRQLSTVPVPTVPPLRVRLAPRPGRWVRENHVGRIFDVYLPAGGRRRFDVPAVLLLHGCNQTPEEFVGAARFTTVADRNGFALIVPRQERHHQPRRCWRWYEPADQARGGGEPAELAGIVDQVLAERDRWQIDPRRVYVAGLSAGGAMALVLAATYPDMFAAAGVHSAPPYRSAARVGQAFAAMAGLRPPLAPQPDAPAMAPMIVVQGAADTVVRSRNGERVVDQWLAYRSAATGDVPLRSRITTGRTGGRSWTVSRWYAERGRTVLEYWLVDGLGHAWSGGLAGGSYSDPDGPRAATLMWRFFAPHRTDRATQQAAQQAARA